MTCKGIGIAVWIWFGKPKRLLKIRVPINTQSLECTSGMTPLKRNKKIGPLCQTVLNDFKEQERKIFSLLLFYI